MGVQPNIALVYNSQSGNGIAGWGFNISGLSAITRVPKNIYLDEYADGVKNGNYGVYELDGNRLLAVRPGEYGAEGSEYRTEIETFAKITPKWFALNDSPIRFEVIAKDGTFYQYVENNEKTSWQLNYIKFLNGQTINYEYEEKGLCSYIKKITYGNNSVEFFYEIRDDFVPVHFDQKKDTINRTLHKIICRQADAIFREYTLEYTKDYYSRLVKITKSNGGGEMYNPTIFEWGISAENGMNVIENINIQKNNEVNFADMTYFSADINGDGLSDLFGVHNHNLYYYIASKESDGNIKFTPTKSYPIDKKINIESSLKSRVAGNSIISLGDGKHGLLFFSHSNKLKFTFAMENSCQEIEISSMTPATATPVYAVGDMDNDGRTEIIYFERESKNKKFPGKIVKLRKTGNEIKYDVIDITINTGSGDPQPRKLYISDFDGDGMNDFLVLTKNGYLIYYNNGGTFENMFSEKNKITSKDFDSDYSRVRMGDFNGDGLPDLLLNEPNNNNWHIAFNNGGRQPFVKTPCSTLTGYNFKEETRMSVLSWILMEMGNTTLSLMIQNTTI